MRARLLTCVLLAACGGSRAPAAPTGAAASPGPAAPTDPLQAARRVVTDTYHGVAVEDPYQWLEADTPEVAAWSERQNQHARAQLDALPELAAIRAEYAAIFGAAQTHYSAFQPAGKRVFLRRKLPDREQAQLVSVASLDQPDAAKLVFDPTAAGDATRTIDWFAVSPDGKRVAVSVSSAGSEAGELQLLDATTGAPLEAPIPSVNHGTGLGAALWSLDGKSLLYTRYPLPGEPHADEPMFWLQVRRHVLGTPFASDPVELGGDELPRIAEVKLARDSRGRALASVQQGDSGKFRHYLRATSGAWSRLDDWDDGIVFVGFSATPDLWVISRKDAPRGKVLRLAAKATSTAQATLVIPEGPDAIVTDYYTAQGLIDAGGRLFLVYQRGGPSELRVFGRSGKPLAAPALPPVAAVDDPVAIGDDLVFAVSTYTAPTQQMRFTAKTGAVAAIPALAAPAPVDLSAFEVQRATARSADGTEVPYSVVWPKGAPRDGSVPCVAHGYGGFGISLQPSYALQLAPLLARGICFIEANLRGGSELGEAWHAGGMLLAKQHTFDDFAAVLRAVVAQQLTRADRLGIIGGSNGGLLIGATITQHPELAGVAVAMVGIYDMLRNERTANGSFVVPEYGSVADPAQFAALHAYSPYHRALRGPIAYPPTLFTTGANDPRVAPWHSRKLVAAMRATGAAPLLRTSATSGHGSSSMTARIDDAAHVAAFLAAHLKR